MNYSKKNYDDNQSSRMSSLVAEFFSDISNAKVLINGETYFFSIGEEKDCESVTSLIHKAFNVWKLNGFDLSPMQQTVDQTKKHLVGKGLVLKNSSNEVIATLSFELGRIKSQGCQLLFFEGDQEVVPYKSISNLIFNNANLLIFKKLAVHPNYANSGIGKIVLRKVEGMAIEYNFDGVLLETVEEADWLYNWYLKESYSSIGHHNYPSRPLVTVLMFKPRKKLN